MYVLFWGEVVPDGEGERKTWRALGVAVVPITSSTTTAAVCAPAQKTGLGFQRHDEPNCPKRARLNVQVSPDLVKLRDSGFLVSSRVRLQSIVLGTLDADYRHGAGAFESGSVIRPPRH